MTGEAGWGCAGSSGKVLIFYILMIMFLNLRFIDFVSMSIECLFACVCCAHKVRRGLNPLGLE